jgi:hypothetical protein
MNRRSAETRDWDTTMSMLSEVVGGSVASLANYHLMKLQLENIRNLPQRDERDRNAWAR